jgi:hypothetical protein
MSARLRFEPAVVEPCRRGLVAARAWWAGAPTPSPCLHAGLHARMRHKGAERIRIKE